MAVFKCKACGGLLKFKEQSTVCTCDFCGLTQTLPQLNSEKKNNLFTRANRLRLKCDFDNAESIYNNLVSEFPNEAEAYWGLCLCKFGVEYIEDPITGDQIPTCHRTCYDSILNNSDFNSAINYSDEKAREIYEAEAKKIEDIQRRILDIAKNEKPYDVFICYKESDENKNRTADSVLAQEIYDKLTEKGLKVFFSRITLEDKLGVDYEPYIFSALNSAKVMLVVTTNIEYVNSTWVKNEWGRYIRLQQKDNSKFIIPCYQNIDPEELPILLNSKQAQDMSKIGAMQDLIHGVMKLFDKHTISNEKIIISDQVKNIVALGFMDVMGDDKEKAENTFRLALQMDKNCVGAYLGLLLTEKSTKKYLNELVAISPKISEYEKSLIDKNNCYSFLEIFVEYNNKNNLLDRIEYIMSNHKDVIDNIENQDNILFYAITKNNLDSIKFLAENYYDINELYPHYEDGKYIIDMMPLSEAIYDSNLETIEYLLKIGANPDSFREMDNDEYSVKYSVLGDSIWNVKNTEIVKLLINYNANVQQKDIYYYKSGKVGEETMLSYVFRYNYSTELLRLLLENGADPNEIRVTTDNVERPIIFDAVYTVKNYEAIQLFCDYGADLSVKISEYVDGCQRFLTPLAAAIHCSCDLDLYNFKELVNTLLKNGANWDDRITIKKISSTVRKYPFDKTNISNADYLKYLKSVGWRGRPLKRFFIKLLWVIVIIMFAPLALIWYIIKSWLGMD